MLYTITATIEGTTFTKKIEIPNADMLTKIEIHKLVEEAFVKEVASTIAN